MPGERREEAESRVREEAERKAGEEVMRSLVPVFSFRQIVKDRARTLRMYYEALKEAGFDDGEAFDLTLERERQL